MDIKNVVVAGGGVLGSQIAFQSAYKGFNVTVWVRSEESLGRARPKFDRLQDIYSAMLEAMKNDPAAYCPGLADERGFDAARLDELKEQARRARESVRFTTSLEDAVRLSLIHI